MKILVVDEVVVIFVAVVVDFVVEVWAVDKAVVILDVVVELVFIMIVESSLSTKIDKGNYFSVITSGIMYKKDSISERLRFK